MEHRIADEPASLVANWTSDEYKTQLKEEFGALEYDEKLQILISLDAKTKAEGKWEEMTNLIDKRDKT